MLTRPDGRTPVDVSFVITTLNEEKYLPILLASIATQETDLVGELIVVDDDSADSSVAIARGAGACVLHNTDTGNVPAMRNLGLERARGTAVIFADADVAFSPDFVEQMVRPIASGTADATLCLRHAVLESRFEVLPDSYSRSYAWFLRRLPWWCFTKVPVRVLPWLARWIATMMRGRRWVSPRTVPDRVNTPAIAVRTAVARRVGAWRGGFGTHEDTLFCEAIFGETARVLWRAGPVLYVSARRSFPTDARWIPGLVLWPLLEAAGLSGVRERNVRNRGGYREPRGRR